MCERSSLITEFGPESRSPQYDKWTESTAPLAEQEQQREEVRLLPKGRKSSEIAAHRRQQRQTQHPTVHHIQPLFWLMLRLFLSQLVGRCGKGRAVPRTLGFSCLLPGWVHAASQQLFFLPRGAALELWAAAFLASNTYHIKTGERELYEGASSYVQTITFVSSGQTAITMYYVDFLSYLIDLHIWDFASPFVHLCSEAPKPDVRVREGVLTRCSSLPYQSSRVHLWVLWASPAPVMRSYTLAKCACVSVVDAWLRAPGTVWVDVRWRFSQHLSALSCLAHQAHEATDPLDICLDWPRLHVFC